MNYHKKRSNIRIPSNIMINKNVEEDGIKYYMPADLLLEVDPEKRNKTSWNVHKAISPKQRKEMDMLLFRRK